VIHLAEKVWWASDLPAEETRSLLTGLVRDITGNPFQSVTLDSRWATPEVIAIAGGIYEERTFHHLPILADALEDAGCGDQALLAHCRRPGPHARGCWIVDALTKKE
jgi:hypothetical protein